jgi:hypothetical protein
MIKHKVFSWLLFVEGVNMRDMLERQNFFIGHDFSSLLYVCRLKTKQDVTSSFNFLLVPIYWDVIWIQWDLSLPL